MMITLRRDIDYKRLLPAFEALGRGESLEVAKGLVLPAKEKEEEEEEEEETEEVEPAATDVPALFKQIYENYDKSDALIDALNKSGYAPQNSRWMLSTKKWMFGFLTDRAELET